MFLPGLVIQMRFLDCSAEAGIQPEVASKVSAMVMPGLTPWVPEGFGEYGAVSSRTWRSDTYYEGEGEEDIFSGFLDEDRPQGLTGIVQNTGGEKYIQKCFWIFPALFFFCTYVRGRGRGGAYCVTLFHVKGPSCG